MKRFVFKPDIDLFEGIIVTKETDIEYESETVKQTIKDLKLTSEIRSTDTGNGVNRYESVTNLVIYLNENDVLLFEEGRGYYLPSIPVSTIDDAISDITALKSLDKEV